MHTKTSHILYPRSLSPRMFMLLLFLCGASGRGSRSHFTTCTFSRDTEESGVHVDCSGRGLMEIPKHFPVNTTSINLSGNSIKSVTNYSFIGTPKLCFLDLSSNDISSIESRAFWGCQSLKNLHMKENKVYVNGSVFKYLGNLQELAIDDFYDAQVLKPLLGLVTIDISANQECHFDGFNYLINLENLRIGGVFYCRNDTFEKLYRLKIVSLKIDAVLSHIEINALAPLEHLQELMFINTGTGLSKPFDALYALRKRKLTTLVIDNAKSNVGFNFLKEVDGRTLTKERLKYLCQICVSNFSAPNNRILFIDLNYVENSPISKCLKHIDLRKNMITTFTILELFQLLKLTNLEYVDVSDQAIRPIKKSPIESQLIFPDMLVDHTNDKGLIIIVPEYLKVVLIRGVSDSMGVVEYDVNIKNGQRVEKIDFSFNGLTSLKHLYGIPNVKYIDFSGNEELLLPKDFFCGCKKVETLKMTDLSFRQRIIDAQGAMFFICLPQLKHLDISGNRLVHLPSDLFQLNPLLEHLDLSRNIFISIPVHLNLLPNLLLLDVSSNSFGSLDKKTTDDIENHYEITRNLFQLQLKGNFFECSCHNLPFLYWLFQTEVFAEHNGDLSCLTEEGKITKTKHITKHMITFWRNCRGYESFTISAILGTLLLCGILMALLIDTNKTKLVYHLLNALKYQVPKRKRKDFHKDVFLSYADIDYHWACLELGSILEKRNLNLFIWDRDSIPGDCTAEVITENVNHCWKMILYFTDNYERDAWSYLTTMAAINCVDNHNPERLILLLPENENPRVPECLLQVVPESCIFHVPCELRKGHTFWDELEKAIKKET